MADYDLGLGLIGGLQQGLQSYVQAKGRREDRAAQMAAHGLIQDEQGQWTKDPAIKQQEELSRKAKLKGDGLIEVKDPISGEVIDYGYDPEYIKMKSEVNRLASEADPTARALKGLQLDKARSEVNELQRKQTPQGKIEGLDSGSKQRFDNLVMAKNAFNDVSGEFETTEDKGLLGSLGARAKRVGLSKYSEAANAFKESIGRLQSGGAIGEVEAQDFIKLLPTSTDSDEVAVQKLQRLEKELGNRFKTLGLDSNDLTGMGYLNPKREAKIGGPKQSSGLLPAKADAAQQTKEWNGKKYQMQGDHWVEVP